MSTEDKSRTDPDIARRIEQLRREAKKDPFTLPRIEGVAVNTLNRLHRLAESMTPDELAEVPKTQDTLEGINDNDIFVRTRIIPLVSKLLERTQRMVPIADVGCVGYAYVSVEDEEFRASLVIEDENADFFSTLDTPLDMQESWDMAPTRDRDGLRAFAGSSKQDLIDRFMDFTQEYL